MKLRTIHGSNPRNESQIDFIEADVQDFCSVDDFYSAAVRKLWNGYDSAKNTEDYISEAHKKPTSPVTLKEEIRLRLEITPADGVAELEDPTEIQCMQDEWNLKEFVWRERNLWRMFSWGTSA